MRKGNQGNVWEREINGNFEIAEYCETLVATPKGEFRLVHHGGSLGVIPADVKKLSMKQAQAFCVKHFPHRSWRMIVKEVSEWIKYEKVAKKKR